MADQQIIAETKDSAGACQELRYKANIFSINLFCIAEPITFFVYCELKNYETYNNE